MNLEDDNVRLLGELWKLPMRFAVTTADSIATAMREMQKMYDTAIDSVVNPNQASSNHEFSGSGPQPQSKEGSNQQPSQDNETALVQDTMNGLIAFIVPGPDRYSIAQGVSTAELGGIDAGITDMLIGALNTGQPPSPPAALSVALLLNQIAQQINPSAQNQFVSPFASLSYNQKIQVFDFLSQDPSMAQFRRLAGLLIFVPALLAYSEGPVFDMRTKTLTGWPLGWTLSKYSGVADGRNEFKGYFQGRREVKSSCQQCES